MPYYGQPVRVSLNGETLFRGYLMPQGSGGWWGWQRVQLSQHADYSRAYRNIVRACEAAHAAPQFDAYPARRQFYLPPIFQLTPREHTDRLRVWPDGEEWRWELQHKEGVYGAAPTQMMATAAGLDEWQQTYPEDWT